MGACRALEGAGSEGAGLEESAAEEAALDEVAVAPGPAAAGGGVGGDAGFAEMARVAPSAPASCFEKRGQWIWYSHQGQRAIFFGANTVVDRISSMRAIVESRSSSSSSGVRVEVRVRFLAT